MGSFIDDGFGYLCWAAHSVAGYQTSFYFQQR